MKRRKQGSCFWIADDGSLFVGVGCMINGAISEAVEIASETGQPLTFEFNGVHITAAADSSAELLLRDFHRAMQEHIARKIGPYPAAELTAEEVAHAREVDAANEAAQSRAAEEYRRIENVKREALLAAIKGVTLELSDPVAWQEFVSKNQDSYGAGCVDYAQGWGRLMQARMAEGKPLAEIAEETSSLADVQGITGFMYGCAVAMLAKCWKHGEELRRRHNLKIQISNEGEKANESGGVLNPALLSLKTEG